MLRSKKFQNQNRILDAVVKSSVAWSAHLDPIFANNLERDAGLSWQYFGSTSGFVRRFPGTEWPHSDSSENRPIDDFRAQDWFTQAAASAKDIVCCQWNTNIFHPLNISKYVFAFSQLQMILLDASGSMSGKSFELALTTVNTILDMLSDNDFVNLIAFSDKTRSVVPCFKDKMVKQ